MLVAATIASLAIVTQDQASLRAAPRESAPVQAVLWQGESLEIRGEDGDYLQVYDHRRERGGYIRLGQTRVQPVKESDASELLSITRLLRDMPGSEALGITYAATYLSAAPVKAIDGEIFDAIGRMAERLALRAGAPQQTKRAGETLAAHLDVVANYGIKMKSFERDGRAQLCYDGQAHRRVLNLPASNLQRARAALSLTRHECVLPDLTPAERFAIDNERAEILDKIETHDLAETVKNRLHMRKAGIWASLAYQRVRRTNLGTTAAAEAAERAIDALAAVNKSELMESDMAAYNDAAIRVGVSRWAAELTETATKTVAAKKLSIATTPGQQPGETCVHLVDAQHDLKNPLLTRCTYGVVWDTSTSVSRDGTALTLAVQPSDTWREMWLFQISKKGWKVDVVPPSLDAASIGYIEFAGWTPGTKDLLAAREVKDRNHHRTLFEVLRRDTLVTDKHADKPSSLSPFYRWQDPSWKAKTVSLR